MGGYVAMEIMSLAPERVVRLAMIVTMVRPDDETRAKTRRELLSLAQMGKFKGVTPHLLPNLIHPRAIDTPIAAIVQTMAETVGKEGFIRQQQAIIDRPDYRPMLQIITVNCLVVVGENDRITPKHESQLIHQGVVGSKLVTIDECGHLPPLEKPELTTRLLSAWLQDDSAS